MSSASSPRLDPRRVALDSPEYQIISAWPYPDEPFYVRQVPEMLRVNVPHHVRHESGVVWAFFDPAADGRMVGFGTLCASRLYAEYVNGMTHAYIPLLAADPTATGRGYGRAIVDFLVAEAVVNVAQWRAERSFSPVLFLDVYKANERAVGLYLKCGFQILNPDNPTPDPEQGGEEYYVMGLNTSIS